MEKWASMSEELLIIERFKVPDHSREAVTIDKLIELKEVKARRDEAEVKARRDEAEVKARRDEVKARRDEAEVKARRDEARLERARLGRDEARRERDEARLERDRVKVNRDTVYDNLKVIEETDRGMLLKEPSEAWKREKVFLDAAQGVLDFAQESFQASQKALTKLIDTETG